MVLMGSTNLRNQSTCNFKTVFLFQGNNQHRLAGTYVSSSNNIIKTTLNTIRPYSPALFKAIDLPGVFFGVFVLHLFGLVYNSCNESLHTLSEAIFPVINSTYKMTTRNPWVASSPCPVAVAAQFHYRHAKPAPIIGESQHVITF